MQSEVILSRGALAFPAGCVGGCVIVTLISLIAMDSSGRRGPVKSSPAQILT